MAPLAVLASSTSWPLVALVVAVVVAVALWGMLRRGSVAHRARLDEPPSDHREPPRPPIDGDRAP